MLLQCRSQIYIAVRALSLVPFLSVLLFSAFSLTRRHELVKVQFSWLELVADIASLKASPTHAVDVLHVAFCLSVALLVGILRTEWAQLKYMEPGSAGLLLSAVSN